MGAKVVAILAKPGLSLLSRVLSKCPWRKLVKGLQSVSFSNGVCER